jgi:hypothetical protein
VVVSSTHAQRAWLSTETLASEWPPASAASCSNAWSQPARAAPPKHRQENSEAHHHLPPSERPQAVRRWGHVRRTRAHCAAQHWMHRGPARKAASAEPAPPNSWPRRQRVSSFWTYDLHAAFAFSIEGNNFRSLPCLGRREDTQQFRPRPSSHRRQACLWARRARGSARNSSPCPLRGGAPPPSRIASVFAGSSPSLLQQVGRSSFGPCA